MKSAAAGATRGAVTGAAVTGTQTVGGNVAAKQFGVDPQRSPLAGVPESMMSGGILGLIFGGIAGAKGFQNEQRAWARLTGAYASEFPGDPEVRQATESYGKNPTPENLAKVIGAANRAASRLSPQELAQVIENVQRRLGIAPDQSPVTGPSSATAAPPASAAGIGPLAPYSFGQLAEPVPGGINYSFNSNSGGKGLYGGAVNHVETSRSTEPLKKVKLPTAGRGILAEPGRATIEEARAINNPLEIATAYGPDGRVLLQKQGSEDSVHFEPEEFAKLLDAVVTHNHPTGNSFSDTDLGFAASANLAELRVVAGTPSGGSVLFRLQRPPQGWPPAMGLIRAYEEAAKTVRARQQAEINAGNLSGRQARRAYASEIMEELKRQLPQSIIYSRTDL
jgi:hypothetical protein